MILFHLLDFAPTVVFLYLWLLAHLWLLTCHYATSNTPHQKLMSSPNCYTYKHTTCSLPTKNTHTAFVCPTPATHVHHRIPPNTLKTQKADSAVTGGTAQIFLVLCNLPTHDLNWLKDTCNITNQSLLLNFVFNYNFCTLLHFELTYLEQLFEYCSYLNYNFVQCKIFHS